ncbi:MAG: N-formylglutamate amidohydrolase [Gammaproteobacteria bacterium]|nr:N-formylglutamate amidohydrolase [Gammaproteobacteria bacterium]
MNVPAAPYEIRAPAAQETPLLVSIPHTGTYIPPEIEAQFASAYIRGLPMTDWHLHHLYDYLPELGATTIYATYSRFVADLNRPPDDAPLYPGRFETGFVALRTFWGEEIYRAPPPKAEIEQRRALVHTPYHARLLELLQAKIRKFGRAVLIDAHSVASRANLLHSALTDDIFLGDRDGRSNSGWLTEVAETAFRAQGLRVARNRPYKGGYITDHYGKLETVEALQIEMCERVYMDERDPARALKHPGFVPAKQKIRSVIQAVCDETVRRRSGWRHAGSR